jgi:hypothetical protein
VARDVADRVAEEVAAWLETRSTQVAEALLESAYRPRVVEPSRAESLAFYRAILLNPDNTLNQIGKQRVIAQYGALAYRDIARSLARALRDEQEEVA